MAHSTSPKSRVLFAAGCAGLFLFGVVIALLGALLAWPDVQARLEVDTARQGDLFLLLYLGLLAGTLGSGPTIDRLGNRLVLGISAFLVTLSLAGFAYGEGFSVAIGTALLLGLGGAGLNVAANALVSDIYAEDERGPMLNLLGVSFGIGALFMPLLAIKIPIAILLGFAMGLGAICTLVYVVTRFPPPREARGFSAADYFRFVRDPGVLLFAFLLFCQSGGEASIGGFTANLVGALGWGPKMATGVLSIYWVALMLGRVLSARALRVLTKDRLVLLSAAGAVAGCAVLLQATSLSVLALGVALVGFSHAAVYPTTLAMVSDRYPRHTGTVFGVLFSIALFGGMFMPWSIGRIAAASHVRYGIALPLAGAAVICVLVSAIRRRESRDPNTLAQTLGQNG